MSFKIIKGRIIQEWLDETINLVKVTLEGKEIPIDLRQLPLQLQERIVVGVVKKPLGFEKLRLRRYPKETITTLMMLALLDSEANTIQLFNIKSLQEIKEGYEYEYLWTKEAPFPGILNGYLSFVLKSLSTLVEETEQKPVNIEKRLDGTWAGTGWAFKDNIYQFEYKNHPPYANEEEELLVLEQYELERQRFKRLKRKYKSAAAEEASYKRERISEEVRIAVWRRDDGKCARCGNRENLEYDHIVPVSKGGGNTARNIELLCESCNRKKSNRIE